MVEERSDDTTGKRAHVCPTLKGSQRLSLSGWCLELRSGTPSECVLTCSVTGGVVAALLNHRLFSVTLSESNQDRLPLLEIKSAVPIASMFSNLKAICP